MGWTLKGGLWIVDVKAIEPIAVGFLPMFSVFDIKVEGDYAYLGTALPAFQIVDISDPEKPSRHDATDLHLLSAKLKIVYIGDRTGLHIFDVTNPGNWQHDHRNGIIYQPVDQAGTSDSLRVIDPEAGPFERQGDMENSSAAVTVVYHCTAVTTSAAHPSSAERTSTTCRVNHNSQPHILCLWRGTQRIRRPPDRPHLHRPEE